MIKHLVFTKEIISLLYRRLRTSIRASVVKIDSSKVFDRLGNPFLNHELLDILKSKDSESAKKFYRKYVESIVETQDGKWLERFIGKTKNINYWITPWGGVEKKHGEKHLSDEYFFRYVRGVLKIKEKILEEGFHPEKFGYITGQLLIDENGEKKVIIWNGHRRVLSLVDLGCKSIKVEISGGDRWNGDFQTHVIKISEVDSWKNVKNGLYTKEEAKKFFYKFFEN
jgi:hypothetical protein